MDGMIISLLRNSVPSLENVADGYLTAGGRADAISWCNYDKIKLKHVGHYDELAKLPMELYADWPGDHNFILLLETGHRKDKAEILFEEGSAPPLYCMGDGKIKRCRFATFTSLTLATGARAAVMRHCGAETTGAGYTQYLHKTLEKHIRGKLGYAREALACDFYSVLGSADIMMVCMADQYTVILAMLEDLMRSYLQCGNQHMLFSMCNTLIAAGDVLTDESFKGLDGSAQIQLTLRGSLGQRAYVDALMAELNNAPGGTDAQARSSIGEFDVVIDLPANRLKYSLYTDGLLSGTNADFRKNVLQSNTRLMRSLDATGAKAEDTFRVECAGTYTDSMFLAETQPSQYIDRATQEFRKVCESKSAARYDYLKTALKLLHADYLRNITSCLSSPWAADLHHQYMATLNAISVTWDIGEGSETLFAWTQEIINNFKQSIYHVSQSNRFIYESPSSHLRNTGPYSRVLRAYYGIVKQILHVAYALEQTGKQEELVPIITIDAVALPRSEIYIHTNDYQGKLLIVISLPFDAYSDIPHYTALLIHEVFHYVCPLDREKRNWRKALIMFSEVLSDVAATAIEDMVDEKEADAQARKGRDVTNCLTLPLKLNALDFLSENFSLLKTDIFAHPFPGTDTLWSIFFGNFLDMITVRDNELTVEMQQLLRVYGAHLAGALPAMMRSDNGTQSGKQHLPAEVAADWGRIIESFEHLAANTMEKKLLAAAHCILNSNYTRSSKIYDLQYGLRDAVCDVAMISISNMTIEDYFSLMLHSVYVQHGENERNPSVNIRIGSVFDFLHQTGGDKLPLPNDILPYRDGVIARLTNQNKYRLPPQDAATLFNCLVEMYIDYTRTYSVYRAVITHLLVEAEPSRMWQNVRPYSEKLTRFLDRYYGLQATGETARSDIDAVNMGMIDAFYIQEDLSELGKYVPGPKPGKDSAPRGAFVPAGPAAAKENPFTKWVWLESFLKDEIKSLKDFNGVIEKAAKQLKDDEKDSHLWFRGQKDGNWAITPSLFRKESALSLYERQNKCYEFFRAKGYSTPEVGSPQMLPPIDWLAYMQHYWVPTNLVDWTDNAMTALYFALEEYLDDTKSDEQITIEASGSDLRPNRAAVFVLNPKRMNAAMRCMMYHENCGGACFCRASERAERHCNSYEVPNLSMGEISGDYRDYILGSPTPQTRHITGPVHGALEVMMTRYANTLPLAILTSQVSQRIRAQSGYFTAFSLASPEYRPDGAQFGNYKFIDLRKLHDVYIVNCRKPKQFLYTILIDEQQKVADWVRNMGIIKSKVYPELSNIGIDVSRVL